MHQPMEVHHLLHSRRISRSLFVAIIIFLLSPYTLYEEQTFAETTLQEARVIAVNDGDSVTIRMNGREYRIRLIGIDAPEMGQEPWGQRSREHLRAMLKADGWNVFLETDVVPYDKYNRMLVYLWDDKKTTINEQMLSDGYAVLFTIQPNSKYADRFKNAQRAARERRLGIWGAEGLKERPLDYKKKHPRQ